MHWRIDSLLRWLKLPCMAILRANGRASAWWTSLSYGMYHYVRRNIGDEPEHFDHAIDLHYQWRHARNGMWVERGVFSCFALKGGDVLELACGDGFNARNFYSLRSRRVVACDFDPKAIELAKSQNSAHNVEYVLADIRTSIPDGIYDNVIWDAAIEHFTVDEIRTVLETAKTRLSKDGILSGYTITRRDDGIKHLSHHEYEFTDKRDLENFLEPHFRNVLVLETTYPSRHNLYFWASDGPLPCDCDRHR